MEPCTPYEEIMRRKPVLSHMRQFDCHAFVHILKEVQNGIFSDRSKEGLLVGLYHKSGYRIYLLVKNKFIQVSDVTFDENVADKKEESRKKPNFVAI